MIRLWSMIIGRGNKGVWYCALKESYIWRLGRQSSGVTDWISPDFHKEVAQCEQCACKCRRRRRRGFHPWVGNVPWSRKWHPTPVFCLENPMDRGACWAAVHGVAKSRTQLSAFTFMHWRRKRQPTLVFLPGESQGRGSLVGCHLWGRTESDTTEAT